MREGEKGKRKGGNVSEGVRANGDAELNLSSVKVTIIILSVTMRFLLQKFF